MVTSEDKKIERYIWGLTLDIQGNVTSSKQAIQMAHNLMDQTVRANAARNVENKIKWNYKRVGHQTRDWNYKSECTKFKNQNRGNQNNGGARGKAFVLGGQEAI
ncbi:hypothetical protein Tco_0104455 [Tanacetum coccineum]